MPANWNKKPRTEKLRNLLAVEERGAPTALVTEERDENDPRGNINRVTCTCAQFRKARPWEAPWCPHTQQVYVKNLDGRDLDGNKYRMGQVVEVTICAKPRLVILVKVVPSGAFYEVAVSVVNVYPKETQAMEPIGLIVEGDGRNQIRQLFVEWLVEKAAVKGLPEACTSPHHHGSLPWRMVALEGHATLPPGTMLNAKFDPTRRDHLINFADLLLTGVCRRCNEDNGVPDV